MPLFGANKQMILITGATGLVGSYLAKLLLQKGARVRAIKRASSDLSLLGKYASEIDWIETDLLDVSGLEQAMKGVKKVYHCAAVISFLPAEVDYMNKVNIEGTANVMNAALFEGVEKLVHVSSVAAFGLADKGKVIDEKYTDPNINKCFQYFRSKHYAEREAWRANAEGLNVVVACPGTIIGAGWWDDEPNSLFREIYNGLSFYTNSTNGFVDVRDVANCLYMLMESNIVDEKFIITSENISFKNLMWTMADALKVKRPTVEATTMLRSFAWRFEFLKSLLSKKRPLITAESAALAAISFAYSNEKIKAALGYEFRPINATINETAQVFLKSMEQKKDWGVFDYSA
jgi:nucleoside-diphosphate-sugar epimerase